MMQRLLRYLWYTTATVVIGFALLLSVARLVLPMMDDYRLQLQDWIMANSGQDVRIGQLDLAWRGLGPEVRLLDVALMKPDSEEPLLEADSLGLGFDLLRYLRAGQLTTKWISLEGAELSLQETEPGKWSLPGHESSGQANPLALLLGQPRLEINRVNLKLLPHPDRHQTAILLRDIQLLLRNQDERHVLTIDSRLEEAQSDIKLVLDLSQDQQLWSGQGYVDFGQFELQRWFATFMPNGFAAQGLLDGECWFAVKDNRLERMQSHFAIQQLQLTTAANTEPLFSTDNLKAELLWQQARSGWSLEFAGLDLAEYNPATSNTQGRLVKTTLSDGETRWQVDANDLATQPFLNLVAHFAPEQYQNLLAGAAPAVHFARVQMAFEQAQSGVELESLTGEFDHLQATAFDSWPGVDNLSGVLSLHPLHGEIVFTSADATLELPQLFRAPFDVSALNGRFSWQHYADRWRLQSQDLYLETPDLKLKQRIRLDIPHAEGSPYLELRGNFSQGKVGAVQHFIPANIMSTKTVEWLDNALIDGAINEGELLFQGRLADFPYDAGEGRMEIRAHVTDGVLQYHPDWPRMDGIDAQLAFINRTMTITSDSARIYDTRLSNVMVAIPNLSRSRLEVSGDVKGDLDDMLRYVNNSPLAQRGYPVAQLVGSGEADLKLKMSIRVSSADKQETTLQGKLAFAGNQLQLKEWDIRLDDIQGPLTFTENGLRSERLLARIWETPAEISIMPGDSDGRTRIGVLGALPLLEQVPADSILHRYLSGRAHWSVQIGLQRSRQAVDLTLQSDMKGIAVKLPAPLGKLPSSDQRLRVVTQVGDGRQATAMLSYGQHSAALSLQKTNGNYALSEAVILFNQGPATLKGVPGIHLGGRLDSLNVEEWQALMAGREGQPKGPRLRSIDLRTQSLHYAGRTLDEVAIQAAQDDSGWRLNFAGPMLDGRVFMPTAQQQLPLELHFKRLILPASRNGEDESLEPQDIPTLNFSAQHFQYASYDLGQVELNSRRSPDGMLIDHLQVNADWIKMNANGSWTKSAGRESSRFKIDVTGGDLGRLLANFGYAGEIVGGETHGTLDANWLGGPDDFALEKLEGELVLSIGAGSLEQLEPGAGRVFGLLNLQSLPRRLALDFTDLFQKGFAFDRIHGSFTLIDTDAYTNNLTIEGPSARIEISGRTGLAARDYDQLVTVVPQVSTGISVAGALAGGPAVGAALFLADRLFGKEIEKFSRYQYSVVGPWRDPQFTRLSSPGNE